MANLGGGLRGEDRKAYVCTFSVASESARMWTRLTPSFPNPFYTRHSARTHIHMHAHLYTHNLRGMCLCQTHSLKHIVRRTLSSMAELLPSACWRPAWPTQFTSFLCSFTMNSPLWNISQSSMPTSSPAPRLNHNLRCAQRGGTTGIGVASHMVRARQLACLPSWACMCHAVPTPGNAHTCSRTRECLAEPTLHAPCSGPLCRRLHRRCSDIDPDVSTVDQNKEHARWVPPSTLVCVSTCVR